MEKSFENLIEYIRTKYAEDLIPLHRPIFIANERRYLMDCIDSNFVSSAGEQVSQFENKVAEHCGTKYAIATVNGTAALHVALLTCGVKKGTEVLTQALTFVATANAISYAGAKPIFIDVDRASLGISPDSLCKWIDSNTTKKKDLLVNNKTGATISACLPMHTFGFPSQIEEIAEICRHYGISLIEDCAESLGSVIKNRHTGTFGAAAAISFNGNKIITTGGGGMVITNDAEIATHAKHLTTTAKLQHAYEFFHDAVGYNYRMPNINAALGLAQVEVLNGILKIKREVASDYAAVCEELNLKFQRGRAGTSPNYWLNTLILDNKNQRDVFLEYSNRTGVMCRPIWKLMTELPMYEGCQSDGLTTSIWLSQRVVNLPSSIPSNQAHRLVE